jgi:hypothetical protein
MIIEIMGCDSIKVREFEYKYIPTGRLLRDTLVGNHAILSTFSVGWAR